MHNCRSTHQQRLYKETIIRYRATMNHCRSAPLRGIGTLHNSQTTQRITDRKQVVWRVVDHNYHFTWRAFLMPIFVLKKAIVWNSGSASSNMGFWKSYEAFLKFFIFLFSCHEVRDTHSVKFSLKSTVCPHPLPHVCCWRVYPGFFQCWASPCNVYQIWPWPLTHDPNSILGSSSSWSTLYVHF